MCDSSPQCRGFDPLIPHPACFFDFFMVIWVCLSPPRPVTFCAAKSIFFPFLSCLETQLFSPPATAIGPQTSPRGSPLFVLIKRMSFLLPSVSQFGPRPPLTNRPMHIFPSHFPRQARPHFKNKQAHPDRQKRSC